MNPYLHDPRGTHALAPYDRLRPSQPGAGLAGRLIARAVESLAGWSRRRLVPLALPALLREARSLDRAKRAAAAAAPACCPCV